MAFNSIVFLIYLPLVLCCYWGVFNRWRINLRNWYLVAVSYIFYGWWDYRFLILIFFTSLFSFICGIWIESIYQNSYPIKKAKYFARVVNALNIITNLLILFLFKYYNFFISELVAKIPFFDSDPLLIDFILPVGISFYTFQALSYTIDVYRKDIIATKNISAYLAYISFFPQLVAGPIERAKLLLPQFLTKKEFNYNSAVDGCRQLLWGFFKKVVIADPCGELVNYIFKNYELLPGSSLVIGAILFAIQIYCDFSGYSDIAIGIARLFNINLSTNFRFPYFSSNINEFWKRWHISLTDWLRDYIYIPLKGNRGGKIKWIRNILIVFLISGIWHGANWTYILWGIFNGLLLIAWGLLNYDKNWNKIHGNQHSNIVVILLFFALTCIGWIFFRAENVSGAFDYINRIFSSSVINKPYIPGGIKDFLIRIMIPVAILFGIEWFHRYREHGFEISYIRSSKIRWSAYYALIIIISFYFFNFHQNIETFIYFQF